MAKWEGGSTQAILLRSGILIEANFSRATGRPIGRFQAQSFRNFLLPFRRAERAAALHALTTRFPLAVGPARNFRSLSQNHPARTSLLPNGGALPCYGLSDT
jgi:hypothetical protein